MPDGENAAEDHAAREEEPRGIVDAAGGQIAAGYEVAETLAVAEPLLVEAGDGQHIRDADLVDEGLRACDQLVKEGMRSGLMTASAPCRRLR